MYLWVNMLTLQEQVKLNAEAVIVDVSQNDNLVGKFANRGNISDVYYVIETTKKRVTEIKKELLRLSPHLEFKVTARPPARRAWSLIGKIGSHEVGRVRG